MNSGKNYVVGKFGNTNKPSYIEA